MKKFYFKKSGILFKWFLSYLCIFMIPFIICSFYYYHTYKVIKQENMSNHGLILENIKNSMNSTFQELQRISTTLQLNNYVKSLSYSDSVREEAYFDRLNLEKDLANFKVANSMIQEINILFPQDGYIVTSTSIYQKSLTNHMPSSYISSSTWDMLCGDFFSNSIRLYSQPDTQTLLFVRPLILDSSNSPKALLA